MALPTSLLRTNTPLEAAYLEFRLEKVGLSRHHLAHLDYSFDKLRSFLEAESLAITRLEEIDAGVFRRYRAWLTTVPLAQAPSDPFRPNQLQPETRRGYESDLIAFLRWGRQEGYPIDGRVFEIKLTKRPKKEPLLYTIDQLQAILAACTQPNQEMVVRTAVGGGLRRAEIAGLCKTGPDGLSDLQLTSDDPRFAYLRVRWNAGAKGMKTRWVVIAVELAKGLKRYENRFRPDSTARQLLLSVKGTPLMVSGVDSMMDRIQERVGFRVHAHAFRYTFGTVAVQLGWPLERVRFAMGHEDYETLAHYVRMASERDLGQAKEWRRFIADLRPADSRELPGVRPFPA